MHLHVSRVRHGGKIYEYARLVESFRNANGVPSLRVIANLGKLDAVAIKNLQTTLRASRVGKRVHAERAVARSQPLKPMQNLRFLDVAVLLELARRLGVTGLLDEVLPRGAADVSPGDVVLALCLQRCVDAGSKLYAERWFPRSALPELLGIAPSSFHNTRIHRVLDALDDASELLMKKLPLLYARQGETTSAMFLDCTDTRFVGHGPELAEVSKTKEGLFERKVGILLLCDKRGLPLRWKVLSGKTAEPPAMYEMLQAIRGLGWVGSAPVVIDRIMGASAEVQKLLSLGVRFVTAGRTNEFAAYAPNMPHAALEDLSCAAHATNEQLELCAREAARRIGEAGFAEVADVASSLWVQDLGIVECDAALPPSQGTTEEGGQGARAIRLAREVRRSVEQGAADSLQSASRKLGLTSGQAKKYQRLLRLEQDIQDDLLAGRFATVSLAKLLRVAELVGDQVQRRMLESFACDRPRVRQPASPPKNVEPDTEQKPLRVRAVVSFNPDRFVFERRAAQALLDNVQAAVEELNVQLRDPRSRRTLRQVERAVERLLERKKVVDLYKVHIDEAIQDDRIRYTVRAELKPMQWQKRRRHHGFGLLLGHPDLREAAAEIARLYRDKDRVEKDFQTIKSLIKLRPVWHRTDQKVRAHVTICVLALLLERLLDVALPNFTSGDALETLATCQLNRFDGHRSSHYLVTEPTPEQRALLRSLRLECLVDDDALATQIRPRAASL